MDTHLLPPGHGSFGADELEHRRLLRLLALLAQEVHDGDAAACERRYFLFCQLRELVAAHDRLAQRPGAGHALLGDRDVAARLAQLEVIAVDHPLWRCHLDELAARLRVRLEREARRRAREAPLPAPPRSTDRRA